VPALSRPPPPPDSRRVFGGLSGGQPLELYVIEPSCRNVLSVLRNRVPANWAASRRAPRVVRLAITVSLAMLMAVPLAGTLTSGHSASAPSNLPVGTTSALLRLPILQDSQSLQGLVGILPTSLTDRVAFLTQTPTTRAYLVTTTTLLPAPLLQVVLSTNPISGWANPNQLPGGPDALPPLPLWSWSVATGGTNDTSNWTANQWGFLTRTADWHDASYVITGSTHPLVTVNVTQTLPNGFHPPRVSYVLNPSVPGTNASILPPGDPDFGNIGASLQPSFVKFSFVAANTSAYWNPVTLRPAFNFAAFDAVYNYTLRVHGQVMLVLPIGTWGNGNLMPSGMPLNLSETITVRNFPVYTGYFPTVSAYRTYVQVIAAHVVAAHEWIRYWSIGNELPLINTTEVGAYVQLFNVAQAQIHAVLPAANVGGDAMTNQTYLSQFASASQNVGFLSFHYYPAIGICVVNGVYCPPSDASHVTTDPRLWMSYASMDHVGYYPPHLAQQLWYNTTHRWLPVFDSESNLNGAGGGPASMGNGSDPRQQTLFGAAWVLSTIMFGASENLSSFTYFSFTGTPPSAPLGTVSAPYGGWGFGLTAEGPSDSNVLYAPYYALRFWSTNVPAQSRGATLNSSQPTVISAYVAETAKYISVVLVNKVAAPVSIALQTPNGGLKALWAHTLDNRTYVEQFNATLGVEQLVKSGIGYARVGPGPVTTVTLNGYGAAVVRYQRFAPNGTPLVASPPSPSTAGDGLTIGSPAPFVVKGPVSSPSVFLAPNAARVERPVIPVRDAPSDDRSWFAESRAPSGAPRPTPAR
jgi:hypothetical protein